MLRNDHSKEFADLATITNEQYKISPDDILTMQIFTNEGEKIIDPFVDQNAGAGSLMNQMNYLVEPDGLVRLPILGRIQLSGFTQKEAELLLEDKYAVHFKRPFVQLRITNKKVIIIKGGNNSSVITLTSPNTTLYEAIAQSSGIGDGKVHKIKLIRKSQKEIKIYQIDLSRMKNVNQGNIVLQADDIVYIEPRDRVPQEIMNSISPYLATISAIAVIITLFAK
ncbi:MAG: polysaccharide biosynthesis/export family protein [Bacteroidota bacterium]